MTDTTIKLDDRNYRIHDDHNKELINKSLQDFGAGRSILIDKEGTIIAGNGTYEQAKKLGIPTRVIQTNGEELIAVQRTDLGSNDEKRQKLAIMDNSTSDLSKFDIAKLQEDFSVPELQDMGVPAFDTSNVDLDGFFEASEPKEKKPRMAKCPHCGEEFEI